MAAAAEEQARQARISQTRAAARQIPDQRRWFTHDPENVGDDLADGEPSPWVAEAGATGSGGGGGAEAAQRSHQDTVKDRELKWRKLDTFAIDTAVACAPELAAQCGDELAALTGVLQQRITSYSAQPKHACEGYASIAAVEVKSWRTVELITSLGTTPLTVPTLCCQGCGVFEMPAAAARCTPSTPSKPVSWYHESLMGLASELCSPPAGVSVINFATSFNRCMEASQSLQLEPFEQADLDVKTFGNAMRHRNFQHRQINDPAQHGAPIFDGPLAYCPACSGTEAAVAAETAAAAAAADADDDSMLMPMEQQPAAAAAPVGSSGAPPAPEPGTHAEEPQPFFMKVKWCSAESWAAARLTAPSLPAPNAAITIPPHRAGCFPCFCVWAPLPPAYHAPHPAPPAPHHDC